MMKEPAAFHAYTLEEWRSWLEKNYAAQSGVWLAFTPRKDTAKWSAVNIARVKRLIAQGRMREPGRAKIPGEVLA